MHLIDKISSFVTPHVLAQSKVQIGDNTTKATALSVFYPVFLFFLSQDSTYEEAITLPKDDKDYTQKLLDKVFFGEAQSGKLLMLKLAEHFQLPNATTAALVSAAAPLTLKKIQEILDAQSDGVHLRSFLTGFNAALPAWASGLLPTDMLAGGATLILKLPAAKYVNAAQTPLMSVVANEPEPTVKYIDTKAAMATHSRKKGSFIKSLLPIIGLLIFGGLAWVLLRSCQNDPKPIAAPSAMQQGAALDSENISDGVLALAVDDSGKALRLCHGLVGLQDEIDVIGTSINKHFHANLCQFVLSDKLNQPFIVNKHLDTLLNLIDGVPRATLGIVDNSIRFGGADKATIDKMVADAKALLPVDFDIQAGDLQDVLMALKTLDYPIAEINFQANTPALVLENMRINPASISLITSDKGTTIQRCHAQVGSEVLADEIRDVLSSVFKNYDDCKIDISKIYATDMPKIEHLKSALTTLKNVSNISISISGQDVQISDQDVGHYTGNDKTVKKLIGKLRADVTDDSVRQLEKSNTQAVTNTKNEKAKRAIGNLTDRSTADELIDALNMQVINFASGTNDIPMENREILDLAAAKMKELTAVNLKIIGHTDNQGSYEVNQKLSQSRADAVRDYLVARGIDKQRLTTDGVGSNQPLASNETQQGRFQNRRIEFALSENK